MLLLLFYEDVPGQSIVPDIRLVGQMLPSLPQHKTIRNIVGHTLSLLIPRLRIRCVVVGGWRMFGRVLCSWEVIRPYDFIGSVY